MRRKGIEKKGGELYTEKVRGLEKATEGGLCNNQTGKKEDAETSNLK